MIEYNLIRTKRKTIAIHITGEATIEVRSPMKTPKAEIDKLIMLKEKWITKHLSAGQARKNQKQAFTLNIGDMVLVMGKEYPIKVVPGNKVGFNGECIYVPENSQDIKQAVIQVYKLLAKNVLTKKVAYYAQLMNVAAKAVKINSAKTRWGSCSGKNSINFSWKLILANDNVIDYVVVHELAHIKEHNHSRKFWDIVAAVFPDYKAKKQQLKSLQERISVEDWE